MQDNLAVTLWPAVARCGLRMSTSVTTYVYNALGQRVKKSGGGITTAVYFMYDEAEHLIGQYKPPILQALFQAVPSYTSPRESPKAE